jgi:hypothetical protein
MFEIPTRFRRIQTNGPITVRLFNNKNIVLPILQQNNFETLSFSKTQTLFLYFQVRRINVWYSRMIKM